MIDFAIFAKFHFVHVSFEFQEKLGRFISNSKILRFISFELFEMGFWFSTYQVRLAGKKLCKNQPFCGNFQHFFFQCIHGLQFLASYYFLPIFKRNTPFYKLMTNSGFYRFWPPLVSMESTVESSPGVLWTPLLTRIWAERAQHRAAILILKSTCTSTKIFFSCPTNLALF